MSDDLFSKALENPDQDLNLRLPRDDVDLGLLGDGVRESEDDEAVADAAKADGASSGSSDCDSDSDSSDSEDDSDGQKAEDEDAIENEDEDEDLSPSGPIISKNEVLEEAVPELPEDYEISEKTIITPVGVLKSAFENNIIIHATLSGEKRVLKEGSIFCLEDRTLIGMLAEVFGPLQNPFYRVKLADSKKALFNELKARLGEKACIVTPDAHWIDTFELRRIKGTDASNGYDEELPEEEQEFSDDEKEALFKKMKKQHQQQQRKKRDNRKQPNDSDNVKSKKPRQPKPANLPKLVPPVGMSSNASLQRGYKSRNARENTKRETGTVFDQNRSLQIPMGQQQQPQFPANNYPYQLQPNNMPYPAYPPFPQPSNFQYPLPPFGQVPPAQFSNGMPYMNVPPAYNNMALPTQPPFMPVPQGQAPLPYGAPPMGQMQNPMCMQSSPQMPPQENGNFQQVMKLHQILLQQQQQQQQQQHQHQHQQGPRN
ncbi:NAF1-like protein [Saccharomyces kudriavzevii IFO 1802]|uniref:H/ACA ribonucleoprotein complex non-core subunit NAF1 n=1 Tax=Saccharomyces kudriavzevii (strain ATCC MYA-4449 / AS 2.2408 / CBS 8840 / NBRC 1802 / NCYC 2889) TaxID=226230 RepID=J6EAG1_SACK1|nr:NAF1-like protein [Saccharomyces kudriavzevii IFO 1802]